MVFFSLNFNVHILLFGIQDLLEAGVPWDERDDQGDQPIHYAAMSGCVESVGLLVKAGAYKCSPGKKHVLDCFAQYKSLFIWMFVSGFRGNTIVHYAAQGAKLELIEEIFASGCTVINKVNELSESPLHLAASSFTAGMRKIKENKCCVFAMLCL